MTTNNLEYATLGGGCFWCLDAVFEQVIGVESVLSAYCGGRTGNPDYAAICEGNTGHAEVVHVGFDPAQISYENILNLFFAIHDPTTRNRQGNDVGTQYRSVIYYHSAEQQQTAARLMQQLDATAIWSAPIVTELSPMPQLYPAEEYHQHYFRKNPGQGYCQAVVAPKVSKFRKHFLHLLRAQ